MKIKVLNEKEITEIFVVKGNGQSLQRFGTSIKVGNLKIDLNTY